MKLNPCKNVPAAQMGPAVTHTFTSIEEDAEWLEFFTPVREDFLP